MTARTPHTHPLFVRVTHWLNAAAWGALLVSGVAILLAHPRLYWGEAGVAGGPSLVDLPLPTVLTGQTGWGRSLHFLAAWVCVWTGLVYVARGVCARHFQTLLRPASSSDTAAAGYGSRQRGAYLLVVFALFPAVVVTGLAMSPALTATFPWLATALGGHQSARTVHFVIAAAITVFALGHIVMVALSGFVSQILAMTIGAPGEVRP